MALMLVRVVPSFKKDKSKRQQGREEVFYQEYGNDDYEQNKETNADRINKLYEIVKKDANVDQKFKKTNFLSWLVQRYREPRRYKLLAKSTKRIEKELDLVKFVKRMRSLISGTLGLLSSQ